MIVRVRPALTPFRLQHEAAARPGRGVAPATARSFGQTRPATLEISVESDCQDRLHVIQREGHPRLERKPAFGAVAWQVPKYLVALRDLSPPGFLRPLKQIGPYVVPTS
jgi:hypothetical protein